MFAGWLGWKWQYRIPGVLVAHGQNSQRCSNWCRSQRCFYRQVKAGKNPRLEALLWSRGRPSRSWDWPPGHTPQQDHQVTRCDSRESNTIYLIIIMIIDYYLHGSNLFFILSKLFWIKIGTFERSFSTSQCPSRSSRDNWEIGSGWWWIINTTFETSLAGWCWEGLVFIYILTNIFLSVFL